MDDLNMEKEKLREIKSSFRRAMNADLSNSMRAHGVVYKLNFGVPAPRMSLIAKSFEKNVEDATYLWNEDVRESKILATYLFPQESMTPELAMEWVEQIKYTEIADQITMNLFSQLNYASELVDTLLQSKEVMLRYTAYRLQIRLLMQGKQVEGERLNNLLKEAKVDLLSEVSYLAQAAVQIMDRLSEQSEATQKEIEDILGDWATVNDEKKQQVYRTICYWVV